jgi:hypothetical protein
VLRPYISPSYFVAADCARDISDSDSVFCESATPESLMMC